MSAGSHRRRNLGLLGAADPVPAVTTGTRVDIGRWIGVVTAHSSYRVRIDGLERIPADGPTLVVVLAVLTSVALVASWLPARGAARVNPVEALRTE